MKKTKNKNKPAQPSLILTNVNTKLKRLFIPEERDPRDVWQ